MRISRAEYRSPTSLFLMPVMTPDIVEKVLPYSLVNLRSIDPYAAGVGSKAPRRWFGLAGQESRVLPEPAEASARIEASGTVVTTLGEKPECQHC